MKSIIVTVAILLSFSVFAHEVDGSLDICTKAQIIEQFLNANKSEVSSGLLAEIERVRVMECAVPEVPSN